LKYREYVCVPAAFHLQHPVKVYSSGTCSIGAVPNPVISYGVLVGVALGMLGFGSPLWVGPTPPEKSISLNLRKKVMRAFHLQDLQGSPIPQ